MSKDSQELADRVEGVSLQRASLCLALERPVTGKEVAVMTSDLRTPATVGEMAVNSVTMSQIENGNPGRF